MQYGPPMCHKNCKHFRRTPQHIGGNASCILYEEIPAGIYFRAGRCEHFRYYNEDEPTDICAYYQEAVMDAHKEYGPNVRCGMERFIGSLKVCERCGNVILYDKCDHCDTSVKN